MLYRSTRGSAATRTFSQAVLAGLAEDGGLLVPERLPDLSQLWPKWKGLDYATLATELLSHLATDLSRETLSGCCQRAYGQSYGAPVAPLQKVGDRYLLELVHGPTLAFKDVALQLLGEFFNVILEQEDLVLNIVAATSGDTGSAAIRGMQNCPRVQLFVTHPEGRIAPLQRKQMTTVLRDSVYNIAVRGTFDDCQRMVKELSADLPFKERYSIGAVNSINWARIAAQIVYYFAAYLQLPEADSRTPAIFAVPTGNFGNILAAEYARRMGLPIECLVLASNENDILPKFFQTGTYQRGEAKATHSPAMDIQVASNFERYLYLLAGGDGTVVAQQMRDFQETGSLSIEGFQSQGWMARSCSNTQTLECAAAVHSQYSKVLDPHTATAWWALENCQQDLPPGLPQVVVATAHPAKFPSTLAEVLPDDAKGLTHPSLERLEGMEERLYNLPSEAEQLKSFVAQHSHRLGGVFSAAEEKAG